jgi:dolichol-phosphate mannosyltransferase
LSTAPLARALIVVPTYNERDNVAEIARSMLAEGGASPAPAAAGYAPAKLVGAVARGVELLFVDDNSPDGTGAVIDDMAAADPRIHVLHRAGKLGLGTAYVQGFRWGLARDYDAVVQMDADGSHDPRHLPALFAAVEAGADVAVGSRYVPGGGTVNWGLGRRLLSRGGSLYARSVLGVRVRDMTAGFLCWRRGALEAIDINTLTSNGYSFQIETKVRALRKQLRLVEVPIVFVDRRVGQSKMSRAIVAEAVLKVWRLRGR